jgi:hypothetical protein
MPPTIFGRTISNFKNKSALAGAVFSMTVPAERETNMEECKTALTQHNYWAPNWFCSSDLPYEDLVGSTLEKSLEEGAATVHLYRHIGGEDIFKAAVPDSLKELSDRGYVLRSHYSKNIWKCSVCEKTMSEIHLIEGPVSDQQVFDVSTPRLIMLMPMEMWDADKDWYG